MATIELRNQDCFDFMKTVQSGSIDLVLIDPPYEVSRETNFQSGQPTGRDTDRFRVSMEFGEWDKCFTGLSEVVEQSYRVLRDGGTLICFYDLWKISRLKKYFDRAGFKQLRYVEWIKTNPVPINSKTNYLSNAREIAICGVKKGKPTFNSEYDNGVYEFPICRDKGRFHPTQKPIALMSAIIEKHTRPGDTVLDCFSGSATTAVACKRLDRNFVGCEISKEYYDLSIKRIGETDVK